MLGYTGENERVLPASMSPSSSDGDHDRDITIDSDSDDARYVMDPSDPRAHDKSQKLAVHPTRETARKRAKAKKPVGAGVSRWDSDGNATNDDDDEEEDEDLGERMPLQVVFDGDRHDFADNDDDSGESDDVDEVLGGGPNSAGATANAPSAVTLSKWALARFLVPRDERVVPTLVDPPLEPLNDHILSDFSSRFRGATGDLEVARVIDDADSDEELPTDPFTVGKPLFESNDKNDKAEKGDKQRTTTTKAPSNNRKRPESRYFVTDLATKCFNCGQVGHASSLCMNDKVLKPCFYCGLRGHNAFACPHLPCSTCLQIGHSARECTNRPVEFTNCMACGRVGHRAVDCLNADAGLDVIRCMVCAASGHLHCVPMPPPADRKLFCPNCADRHVLSDCTSYVEPVQPNYTTTNFRMAMKCFVCQVAGHLAAACPQRQQKLNKTFNCFKCGQQGHYASDCMNRNASDSRPSQSSSSSSRKRSRDAHSYTADYDDDDEYVDYMDYDDSSSRNGRKVTTRASARLDAALPSFRGSGSNNSSSGYNNKSSNDRRRQGHSSSGRSYR